MIIIKNERGITLIALVLTIVVTLILTTIAIRSATESMENSRMVQFVSYMQMLQKKVDFLIENGEYENLGKSLGNAELIDIADIIESENSNEKILFTDLHEDTVRFFNTDTISSQLEIEDIKDEIVVNFTNHEIISLKGISYNGQRYYTQYNLPGGQKIKQSNNQVKRDRDITVNSTMNIEHTINGLNATFKIDGITLTNGTLSYSTNLYNANEEPKWTIVTNYTVKDEAVYTKNITKSGTYYFKLTDNTNKDNVFISNPIELRLTNSPELKGKLEFLTNEYDYSNLDSRDWSYAIDKKETPDNENDDELYIWIPRFAYKTEGQVTYIEFLKGTSDLTTSGGYITDDWILPDVFENVTGVWKKIGDTGRIIWPVQNLELITEAVDEGIY